MSDAVDGVAEALRKVFMAGVGAVATVGEKGGQVVESLAERGEGVVRQGRDLNQELARKTTAATADVREDMLRAAMSTLAPETRTGLAAMVSRVAEELNARDAEKTAAGRDAAPAADPASTASAGPDATDAASAPVGATEDAHAGADA